jgi:hypothetical protein
LEKYRIENFLKGLHELSKVYKSFLKLPVALQKLSEVSKSF